jgi:hypothetical protein
MKMWELREAMLKLSAQIAQGTRESPYTTIERAEKFARWVHTGGWTVINNDDGSHEFISTNVMDPWQAPMEGS